MADEKDKEEPSRAWWSEMARDLTATGLATLFMTEDSVRSLLKEKKLPKELLTPLLEGFGKKKDDFYGLVAKEVGRVLAKIDVSQEVGKFLEKHKVHLEAKISFEPKETPTKKEET